MRRAIQLARNGIRAEGEIIGEDGNHVLTTNDPTAHGEIVAIHDACAKTCSHSLEGCVIHTTGQPCPM